MSVAFVSDDQSLPVVTGTAVLMHQNIARRVHSSCQSRYRITVSQRLSELDQLRQLWSQWGGELSSASLWQLAQTAEYLCDWSLLAAVCRQGLRAGDDLYPLFHDGYVQACWMATDYQTALDESFNALLLQPTSAILFERHQQMVRWLQHSHAQCLGVFDGLQQNKLILEPLGQQHAESFLWQYLDSDIPQRCCLPDFNSLEEWHDWYQRQCCTDKRTFAVMHECWGMIGVVSLLQYRDIGFFYYWIGPDFQGNGYGPLAVNMLLQHAWRNAGLRCCYAKVFDDNLASISALNKLAFQPLPFRPQPPFAAEMLFYLGPAQGELALRAEFSELLRFMDSEIVL
ncbi:GNAT family N-acetyltransferase [Gynuella sunshinyii]|uniref:Acetyltransferase, including N-acetylase of ribosomal protein n=1 Tax=Gynuella sunshinyii YC6258 TaxID=1445510 RepID=A0A0C5VTJ7_9GAMM|nr:GNAT family N-acetyltransferase [Gynuella sunshinyii]AJQ97511.1 acetyltransferase, including N-acetylase of ribosomal protein [Gynuella sunshinyii YC6258]